MCTETWFFSLLLLCFLGHTSKQLAPVKQKHSAVFSIFVFSIVVVIPEVKMMTSQTKGKSWPVKCNENKSCTTSTKILHGSIQDEMGNPLCFLIQERIDSHRFEVVLVK